MKSPSTLVKKPSAKKAAPKKAPTKKSGATRTTGGSRKSEKEWVLRLYVAGQTPKSLTAFSNLKRLCEEHLAGRYALEVIDLLQQPQLAEGDQIVALPTLVRKLPEPIKRVVGDLSNTERVLVGMDLRTRAG